MKKELSCCWAGKMRREKKTNNNPTDFFEIIIIIKKEKKLWKKAVVLYDGVIDPPACLEPFFTSLFLLFPPAAGLSRYSLQGAAQPHAQKFQLTIG
jgi:hypothetical protein